MLSKTILSKQVQIKTIYFDKFRRQISLVYRGSDFVNKIMLEKGLAVIQNGVSERGKELKEASDNARKNKLGVFGSECTQISNKEAPLCIIKGNAKQHFYHYPGCGQYNNVLVQLHFGDRWFCTRKEAEKAGFKKAQFCP